ncbi:hypothetical protein RBI22_08810 [Alcaligenaceae bacterium C4P045]|nr:hypothetical protein [Alcaligenaceae bacterium C4P045]
MQFDPRTVAREIPGIFDEIFPQLTPGMVAHFNSLADSIEIQQLRPEDLLRSQLQRAMLFELGNTVAEQLLVGNTSVDWPTCFAEALRKQRAYFDARLPEQLLPWDQFLAELVGSNLVNAMNEIGRQIGRPISIRPRIPGFEWIASGNGDFALGSTLVEVKCSVKRFSSADYRQVAIYWLLSYAASLEDKASEWLDFILLNPRSGQKVCMKFDSFLSIISSGRTKVEIFQLFQSIIGSRLTR